MLKNKNQEPLLDKSTTNDQARNCIATSTGVAVLVTIVLCSIGVLCFFDKIGLDDNGNSSDFDFCYALDGYTFPLLGLISLGITGLGGCTILALPTDNNNLFSAQHKAKDLESQNDKASWMAMGGLPGW